MKAVTWTRDSHGLFDYESHHISKKNLKTHSNCVIARNMHDIQMTNEMQVSDPQNDVQNLLYLRNMNGN